MNENIDLTKILKNCPKGWKFYSSAFGEVEFDYISEYSTNPICIRVNANFYPFLNKYGKYYIENKGECILFPSKDQRDWGKFSAPWYKKEKFDPKTLQPFDKVLVRDSCSCPWRCAFYSHTIKNRITLKYVADNSVYEYCIPYNEDTKHLVGMDEEAPEYYRYWED